MIIIRKLRPLLLLTLLLAGCDQKALLEKFVPKEDDSFARDFIEAVRAGDYASAQQRLDASLRGEKAADGLHELNGLLAPGESVSIEVIGYNVYTNMSTNGTVQTTTNLSYQIHGSGRWSAGNVAVGHAGGGMSVLDAHFRPMPDALEVLNRFTFSGKSMVNYFFFAACLAIPALILVTLIVCLRSRIRRKWLWIIFILFGFSQFRLNWSNGSMQAQPLSISFGAVSVVRASPYAPWILGFALPLGAITFLVLRDKLLLANDAPRLRPAA